MKFAIVFLACFVSMSYQQGGFWPYMGYNPYFSPRLFFCPWCFESQQYFQQQPDSVVINAEDNNATEDVQARIRGATSSSSGTPQNRFFFPNRGFPGFFRPGGGDYGTTTVFATSTSTAIVANFLSCIPGNQFSSSVSAQATNPCARRRRLAAQILDALEEAYDVPEEVIPTPISPVETTTLAEPTEKPSQPAIESSQEHDLNEEQTYVRRERAGYNFVTVSSWITSYSFITTNVKKTYTLASTGGLQCLPPGFVVC